MTEAGGAGGSRLRPSNGPRRSRLGAANRLAWGDLENEWHHLHGNRWPSWQCAGCDAPIGGSQALNLPDGNRVHLDPIDCLIRLANAGEARRAMHLSRSGSNHLA